MLTRRRSSRIEAPHYLAWLRLQRCGVAIAFPGEAARCSGPIDPEHKREGVGMSQCASDADAWACCRLHHDERHDGRGPFAAMDKATLREFIRRQIDMYRAAFTAYLALLPPRDRARPAEVDALALPASLAASDQPPGPAANGAHPSGCRHLSPALEQLLPQPGSLIVGAPVVLGSREGAIAEVTPEGVVVLWVDGERTVELLEEIRR